MSSHISAEGELNSRPPHFQDQHVKADGAMLSCNSRLCGTSPGTSLTSVVWYECFENSWPHYILSALAKVQFARVPHFAAVESTSHGNCWSRPRAAIYGFLLHRQKNWCSGGLIAVEEDALNILVSWMSNILTLTSIFKLHLRTMLASSLYRGCLLAHR